MSSKKKLKKRVRQLEDRLADLEVSHTKIVDKILGANEAVAYLQGRVAELERKNAGPFKGPFDPNPWVYCSDALDTVDKIVSTVEKFTKNPDDKK